MDGSVVQRYAELCGDPTAILTGTRRHFPFDLQKRREAGVFASRDEVLFAVKGAWESLRPVVKYVALPGCDSDATASEAVLDQCDQIVIRESSLGSRIIAVARRRLDHMPDASAKEELLEQSLTLVGFLSLSDPIRAEVPAAVTKCQQAGIRVVLITGDHPSTAESVARQCGILPADEVDRDRVLSGTESYFRGPSYIFLRCNNYWGPDRWTGRSTCTPGWESP